MRETAVRFGDDGGLVGVVTQPAEAAGARELPGIVLLNAGRLHHVGPNRLYVRIARRLAERGFVSLRFDFSGIGESDPRRDAIPFEEAAQVETRAAMDWLAAAHGLERFVLLGICSGASFALQSAFFDDRVVGAVPINVRAQSPGRLTKARAYARKVARYHWRVLLRTRGAAVTKIGRLAGAAEAPDRPTGASARRRDVVDFLRTLTRRGTDVLFLYSESDVGLDYLHTILGRALDDLTADGKLAVEVVPATDHTFTLARSQTHLLETLDRWFDERYAR